jgi:hypothetical protein
LDFGAGFYTTSSEIQARRWAQIKKRREASHSAILSVYHADLGSVDGVLSLKRFEGPSEEWLDFVMANRMGEAFSGGYDIVFGPVANDTLYETLSLYERSILTRAETIVRLRTHKLADQVAFLTEKGLRRLTFEACVEVEA